MENGTLRTSEAQRKAVREYEKKERQNKCNISERNKKENGRSGNRKA